MVPLQFLTNGPSTKDSDGIRLSTAALIRIVTKKAGHLRLREVTSPGGIYRASPEKG